MYVWIRDQHYCECFRPPLSRLLFPRENLTKHPDSLLSVPYNVFSVQPPLIRKISAPTSTLTFGEMGWCQGQGLPAWSIADKKQVTKPRVLLVEAFSDAPFHYSSFTLPLSFSYIALTSILQPLLWVHGAWDVCDRCVCACVCVWRTGTGIGQEISACLCRGCGGGVGMGWHKAPPGEAAVLRVTRQVSRRPLQLPW